MALVTAGKMNKQVAFDLGLSEITVKTYRGAVMQKMAARSFADLVRMADALALRGSSSGPHTKVGGAARPCVALAHSRAQLDLHQEDSSSRRQGRDTLVSLKEAAMESNALAQWAHDIRNTLGTVSLYLESLERPAETDTVRLLARSDALLKKATSMCSDLMREAWARRH